MAVMRALMFLFLVFYVEHAVAKDCPYGWTPFGVNCYKFFSQQVEWATAEIKCQMNGANLASVRSKVQNELLKTLITGDKSTWIGGHDGETDGQWLWTDGSPFDFTSWCANEPNNYEGKPESCLEMHWSSSRCWNDRLCNSTAGFICAQAP
ncbi:ladderlectin-like [Paramisgurnus dabryanus]|uniref:ladderlectin-like n=1 Tax=Paramisgurnus dabryanus TaxID=90735 RepID=UPI0031F3EC74